MLLMDRNSDSDVMDSTTDSTTAEKGVVRIAVLGSQGVGKTSLIEQFVFNHFSSHYKTTRHKRLYFPSAFINDHLYQMQIMDLPALTHIPSSSVRDWSTFKACGVRTANAILLVFDITSVDSYHNAKRLHRQIQERYSDEIPIVVVGNKCDSCDDRQMGRREVASAVKKQWRCPYMEASAKQNWHVTLVFKEVMRLVDTGELPHRQTTSRVQDALRRNSCAIL